MLHVFYEYCMSYALKWHILQKEVKEMAIKKILVPVDFSEHSDRAVEYAMVIANKFRAHVTIVHMIQLITENIIENDFLNTGEKILLWKENERTIQLKKLCKIGKKKGIHMDFNLFRGSSAADTIIDLANEKDFDLVIMG